MPPSSARVKAKFLVFLRFVFLRAFVCRFSVFLRPSVRELDRGAESAPPAGRVRANTPAGRGLRNRIQSLFPEESLLPSPNIIRTCCVNATVVIKCHKGGSAKARKGDIFMSRVRSVHGILMGLHR